MQRSDIVRASVGRDGLDAVKVRDLIAAGRGDAEACWDQVDMCFDGGTPDQTCMEPAKDRCLRASACSR